MSEVKLNLEPQTEAKIELIGVAIRLPSGRVYSQRGATHESLIDFVKSATDASFWHDLDKAERGYMFDNGAFARTLP